MYSEFFKPLNWQKRSAEARRRVCAVLLLYYSMFRKKPQASAFKI